MVARTADGVRVAVTGAADAVFRVPSMEQALSSRFDPSALDGATLPADLHLNDDLHACAEYRAHLVTVMAKRAVAAAGG
jgi:carbon-monoxide dehydrogenase medium subunit